MQTKRIEFDLNCLIRKQNEKATVHINCSELRNVTTNLVNHCTFSNEYENSIITNNFENSLLFDDCEVQTHIHFLQNEENTELIQQKIDENEFEEEMIFDQEDSIKVKPELSNTMQNKFVYCLQCNYKTKFGHMKRHMRQMHKS